MEHELKSKVNLKTPVSKDFSRKKGLIWSFLNPYFLVPLACPFMIFFVLYFGIESQKEVFTTKHIKSYQFKKDKLGFFIGDVHFFAQTPGWMAEEKIVNLFPKNLRSKVKNVIRPVLVLCEKHEVDPFWVLSVMWTESHFKHESVSHKGARGLMQVMPSTFGETLRKMEKRGIILEAKQKESYLRARYQNTFHDLDYSEVVSKLKNLEIGIFYLKGLLKSFKNNYYHATVAYNMGPGWTRKRLKNKKSVGTKNHYLNKVLKKYNHITKNFGTNSNVAFAPRI